MAEVPGGEVLVYEAADGAIRVDVRLEQATVWLTQPQMAEVFGRERSVITKHLRNVFEEGELDRSNVQILHIAGSDKPCVTGPRSRPASGGRAGRDAAPPRISVEPTRKVAFSRRLN